MSIYIFVRLGLDVIILKVSFRLIKYHRVFLSLFVNVLCVRTNCYLFECECSLYEGNCIFYESISFLREKKLFVECSSGGRTRYVKHV